MSADHRQAAGYTEDWRGGNRRPAPGWLTALQILLPLLVLALLATMIYLGYRSYLAGHVPGMRFAWLTIDNYQLPVAPPLAFAREDAAALSELGKEFSYAPDQTTLDHVQNEFLPGLSRFRDGVLVVGVWAHSWCVGDKAYLVCSDFDPNRGSDAGQLPLETLLAAVAASPAPQKLLVIDAGRLVSAPHLGMLANEFPRRLEEAVAKVQPTQGQMWVLSANSLLERSHVSPADQRSVFAHFFAEALRGQADGATGKAGDRVVDLAELYQYVRTHVSTWVWTQSGHARTQTPVLLRAGQGRETDAALTTAAAKVVLRMLPEAKKLGASEPAPAEKTPPAAEPKPATPAASPETPPTKSADSAKPPSPNAAASKESAAPAPEPSAAAKPSSPPAPTATTKTGSQPAVEAKPASDTKPSVGPEKSPASAPATGQDRPTSAPPPAKAVAATTPPPAEEPAPAWGPRFALLGEVLELARDAELKPLQRCPQVQAALADWTASDFAPHLYRRLQESLVAYQDRAVSERPAPVDEPPGQRSRTTLDDTIRGEVKSLRAEYDKTFCDLAEEFQVGAARTSYEAFLPVRDAVRWRNRVLFELPYYVSLQTQLASTAKVEGYFGEATELLAAVRQLSLALENAIQLRRAANNSERRFVVAAAAGPEGGETELEELTRRVQTLREALRTRLQLSDREGPSTAELVAVYDLLHTPLPTPAVRAQGWARVLALGAKAEETSDSLASEPGPAPSDAQLQDARRRTRQAVVFRALLELQLAALGTTAPEASAEFAKLTAAVGLARDAEAPAICDALAPAGFAIRDAQRQLLVRLREPAEDPRIEIGLRLVPALYATDADLARTKQRPIGYVVRVLQPARKLTLVPPPGSERPLPLDRQAAREYVWHLEADRGGIPARVSVAVRYNDKLLRLTDAQDRPLKRDFALEIPDHKTLERWPLPLRISPLTDDGSTAAVTVELPDAGLTAAAQFQTPERRFLDVWVLGQDGTVEDAPDVKAPVAAAAARRSYQPAFDQQGTARVSLRPHPAARTDYEIVLHNASSQPRPVTASIFLVPAEVRDRAGRRYQPWDAERAPAAEARLHAKHELALAPGGTASLPIFPVPPAPAAKDGAAAPAPTPATNPPVEVGAGLLCVLEHTGQRQLLWLDVRLQHPEAYLQPRVEYSPVTRQLRIAIAAAERSRLPAGLCRARWELSRKLAAALQEPYLFSEVDLQQAPELELRGRLPEYPDPRVPVVLTVDGYPRAFEFDCPLSIQKADRKVISRLNAEVLLIELDKEGRLSKDEAGQYVELPPNAAFKELPRIGVLFRADVPPPEKVDDDYRLRIYVSPQDKAGPNTAAGEYAEFLRDRRISVALEKPAGQPGFALRGRVEDLAEILKTSGYLNQKLVVRGEIERLRRTGGDRTVERVLTCESPPVLHDATAPVIVGLKAAQVMQGAPLIVEVEDALSGVASLLFSLARDAQGNLKEPQPAVAESATGGRSTFRIDSGALKLGSQELYVQATDRAGNASPRKGLTVEVLSKPEGPKTGPENSITGKATYFGESKAGIVVKLSGPRNQTTETDAEGRFTFSKLPPDVYKVEAQGSFQNYLRRAPATSVKLEAAPAPPAVIELRLK